MIDFPINIFGTDGIRARVGNFPLTDNGLLALGEAIGQWAQEKFMGTCSIVIAHDTRYSSDAIKAHLLAGLTTAQHRLYDAGILPTPALYYLLNGDVNNTAINHKLSHERIEPNGDNQHTITLQPSDNKKFPAFELGIMITASHNPADDNGIKILSSSGKLTEEDELKISAIMKAVIQGSSMNNHSNTLSNHNVNLEVSNIKALKYAETDYCRYTAGYFKPRFLTDYTVVLDCAHGATYSIAPAIFKHLGAQVITINASPDGYNINKDCGAVYPTALAQAVKEHNAHAGFAFDGDGDRIIAVNRSGEIKNGDDIVAMLLDHPDFAHQPAVVGTVMANQGFEAYLKLRGKTLMRTHVGDKYVNEALVKNQLLLGGEPSGHVILHNHSATGDGILVALKLMETMILKENWDMTSFSKYPQVLINVPIKIKKDLTQPPLSDYIAASEEKLKGGRVLVRYSGTESLVRVMAEDADRALTESVATQLASQIQAHLS